MEWSANSLMQKAGNLEKLQKKHSRYTPLQRPPPQILRWGEGGSVQIDEGREQSGNQKGGARDCYFLTERSNCTFTPGYTCAALDQILLGGGEDWYTYGTVVPTEVLEGMKFYELLIQFEQKETMKQLLSSVNILPLPVYSLNHTMTLPLSSPTQSLPPSSTQNFK